MGIILIHVGFDPMVTRHESRSYTAFYCTIMNYRYSNVALETQEPKATDE